MNVRLRPMKSAIRPPSSRNPPKARVYAVTTTARPGRLMPRSAWALGIARFTIDGVEHDHQLRDGDDEQCFEAVRVGHGDFGGGLLTLPLTWGPDAGSNLSANTGSHRLLPAAW